MKVREILEQIAASAPAQKVVNQPKTMEMQQKTNQNTKTIKDIYTRVVMKGDSDKKYMKVLDQAEAYIASLPYKEKMLQAKNLELIAKARAKILGGK